MTADRNLNADESYMIPFCQLAGSADIPDQFAAARISHRLKYFITAVCKVEEGETIENYSHIVHYW